MSHCQKVLLEDRAVLRLAGTDGRKFLQGLITADMAKASGGEAVYGALLTPQGKILFDFFIAEDGTGGFLLDCRADQAADLAKRLTLYKLRAAVEIVAEEGLKVAALLGDAPPPADGVACFRDPRLAALGYRAMLSEAAFGELPCEPAPREAYDLVRIRNGIPSGGEDFAYGDAFPHEAMLDQLGGVDFKKGCYVGQEVVSRMEHRGTARKRIVPVSGAGALPAPGTAIVAGDAPVGTLSSSVGSEGLALIRLDRAEAALEKGEALTAGGIALTLRKPDWARFTLPGAAVSA